MVFILFSDCRKPALHIYFPFLKTNVSINFSGAFGLLQPYTYEMQAPEHQWIGFLFGVYCGDAIGRTFPILTGLALFSTGTPSWSWRLFILVSSIPIIIFLLVANFLMEESPRFLLATGRTQTSVQVVKKLAARNKIYISNDITLKLEKELASVEDKEATFFEKINAIFNNFEILRGISCIILIGIVCYYFASMSAIIATELLSMEGKGNVDFCKVSGDKNYFMDVSDYLNLLLVQVFISMTSGLLIYQTLKFEVNFKVTATGLLCLAFFLIAMLFYCPTVTVGLLIMSTMQTISGVLDINMSKTLVGLAPTNIRSGIFGISKSIMYIPATFGVYLMPVLADESQHFVTTVTIVFAGFGLLGAFLLPRKFYSN